MPIVHLSPRGAIPVCSQLRDASLVARLKAALALDAAFVPVERDRSAMVIVAERFEGDAPTLLLCPGDADPPEADPGALPLPASISPAMLAAALRQTAEVVRLRRENRRLEELARTDPLTGIANRRALEEQFRLLQNHPSGAPWRVAMFDIDRFKQINARLGHVRGDDVLRAVAGALAPPGAPHEADSATAPFVARLAGDEFLLLVRGKADDFPQQVDLLRAAASASAAQAASEPVTLAAGAAMLAHAPSLAALLHAADEPLRAAKRAGGAQTRSAS